MIAGDATVTIARPPEDIFDFVLDLERYRQADLKIGRVVRVNRDGNRGTTRFWGRMRWGIPSPPANFAFTLEPGRRLTFVSDGGLVARLVDFHGLFECEPLPDGTTRVRHREQFDFRGPLRGVIERVLRRWLERDTAAEMQRVKSILEA